MKAKNKIFVSYLHKDTDIALPLIKKLQEDGIIVLFEEHKKSFKVLK